ncbi:thioredoxin domain-containing protein [soil metagenome]
MNRLAQETSPYLLQHADNPVEWFPWGEVAFRKAEAEDKPVLLSVGYSACHWCHVMAHESFEDAATAEYMNAHFINVKVDREERPDVDAVYMNAVQAMTGHGGWPMTVVMTPSGEPFFGGTYFPLTERYGQPSFMRVLSSLADAWQNRREEVLESARGATQYLRALSAVSAEGELSKEVLQEALTTLMAAYDPQNGGFGGAPKFPPHSALRFLLQRDDVEALSRQMAETTLVKMARGGIYDHLGGGFARYSVDAHWLVPHVEKRLYDNAQLVQRYAEAYSLTGEALFKTVVEDTLAWVEREMTSPEGGFYSALDADSEGVEGKFYVWDEAEVEALLAETSSAEDVEIFKAYFDVSTSGNFEGKTILNVPRPPAEVATAFGLTVSDLETKVTAAKKVLLEARATRVRPGLDDKVLTSWNGLMLAAFADAGRLLGEPKYVAAAVKNAAFVRANLFKDGRFLHSYKDGVAKIGGLLEDYAYYGLGLLALYRATLAPQWLLWAVDIAEAVLAHFQDKENGGFFSTPDDGEQLITRPKNYFASPNPSANAATAELLLELARLTGREDWETLAADTLKPMVEAMRKQPNGFGTMLYVLTGLLQPPREVALFGNR